ncbi:GTPase Era [Entomobacter blattae]|uniref:GTPase Era n=1 Tax=Entomobacter blattae TaxID=2762277 RepID=A0A7H1NSK4_9PROT|nr:GTPase Era [Entomobacter blattae]QNT78764.1 GTPase Era [Entomobacter blattae]
MELDKKCGFVALIGAANAGKSTLLNRLTGAKLSIVSPKAQTTRFRVLGILVHKATQIILVDTPGIFKPRRSLDRAMVSAAWSGMKDADITLFLVDVREGVSETVVEICKTLSASHKRIWLLLNKIDLVPAEQLLPLTTQLSALLSVEHVFMISASKGDGVEDLLDKLADSLPAGPFLYPEDEMTDLPDRLLASEIVREQVFLQTHEEVPYSTTVETESFKSRKDGSIRIEAIIYVSRASHKSILVGEGGSKIRSIGQKARTYLSTLFEKPVHLFLTVKEKQNWAEDKRYLRSIGLQDNE